MSSPVRVDTRRVVVNAGMAVLQVLCVGATLFFVYGFLIRTIGAANLGIWSLVLASSSVGQLADLGLGSSAVKFVAKYAARNDHDAIAALLETTLVTMGVVMAFFLFVLYPAFYYGLKFVVQGPAVAAARMMLPFGMLSVWLMSINGVLTGGLAGFQRIDLRARAVIAATLLYGALSVPLVRRYGLLGVAYAQVGQQVALGIFSWILLRRFVRISLLLPRWSRLLFREMFRYGVSLQVVGIATTLTDPLTKAILSVYGGLADVGYYEMASRLFTQVRGLVVSANQVLVPAVADLAERAPKLVRRVYVESYRVAFVVALFLYGLVTILLPLISTVWVGHYEANFAVFGVIIAVAYFVNTLVGPAYFVYLGEGRLRWVTLGHLAMAACNVLFGALLGMRFGGIGVVLGWASAVVLGSVFITVAYHLENRFSWAVLLPRESLAFLLSTAAVSLAALAVWTAGAPGWHGGLKGVLVGAAFAALAHATLRKHPVRLRLQGWLKKYPLKGEGIPG